MSSLVWAALAASAAETVSLPQALDAAEANSLDLQMLRARTEQMETYRGQAWSLLSPKLVAQSSYTVNEYAIELDPSAMIPPEFQPMFEGGEPIVVQPKEYLTASVTVQQTLFSGTALPLLLGAYRTVDATRGDESAQRNRLRAGVAKSYYGLYTTREAEALALDALATAEDQLEFAQKQVAAEIAAPRTVIQAELRLSQAKRDVQSAHAARVQAEEVFHQLTALDRDVELALPTAPPVPASMDEALDLAIRQRPDLAADQMRITAARHQVRGNWMGWAPTVNGRFTYAYTENTGFSDDKTLWMAVVEGEWVLWDGGYRLNKGREYVAQLHQAELFAERNALTAEGEVRNAWEGWERARAALAAQERDVALAEENLRLARLAFEADSATFLEVQMAELGVHAARLQNLVERMNADTAAIDLAVATGRY